MKSRSVFAEAAALVVVSLIIGTAVHVVRGSSAAGAVPVVGQTLGDPKLKIAFVGKYGNRCSTLAPALAAGSPQASPAPPVKPGVAAPPSEAKKQEPPKPGVAAPTTAIVSQPPPKAPSLPSQQAEAAPKEAKPARSLPPGVVEIGLDQVVEEHQGGVTVFLDARRTRNFDAGRIKGARSFSVWEADLDQKIDAFLKEVPLDLSIVIYCGGGDCEDSHNLAERLQLAGFKDLRVFVLGYSAWMKAGHSIEKTAGAADVPIEGEEEHPEGEKGAQKE